MLRLVRRSLLVSLALATIGVVVPGEAQEAWPPGFYRRTNQSTIRYLSPDGRSCTVKDRNQLNAFGGDAIVRVVGPRSNYEQGRTNTGVCPWPDGIYRESSWSGVWQLLYSSGQNRRLCTIPTEQQLQAYNVAFGDGNKVILIRTVPNGSRLGFKRTYTGECAWPATDDGA